MSAVASTTRHVALIGNPNTGKTTLFNALTGMRARVGNYAGVTVERREGRLSGKGRDVVILDLPGTYSLAAQSPDEMVAVRALLGALEGEERPALIVVVVDASNLERNLFLATQAMEAGAPVVIALNMTDMAEREGIKVDADGLARALGVPVVEMVARNGIGTEELAHFIATERLEPARAIAGIFPDAFHAEEEKLRAELAEAGVPLALLDPFLVRRALLDVEGMTERAMAEAAGDSARARIVNARRRLEETGVRIRALEATGRYRWIRANAPSFVTNSAKPADSPAEFSDRVDRILTHRVWGTIAFVFIMGLMFQAIYTWSGPAMDAIDAVVGYCGELAASAIPEGPLQSLVVDGAIAGVGGIVIFLPQILILFFFICLLEDIGYMSRAAFLMDRLLSRCGLSGRSFIPMLSSFACAIPGVMAARSIEDPRDRLTTILVAPLMSCSARLPVYILLIEAFVPDQTIGFINLKALVMLAMYLLGVVVAIPVALILKKTLLKGKTPVFLMELPPYRRPVWMSVAQRVSERGMAFVVRAGTLILATSIIIWALGYYPRPESIERTFEAAVVVAGDDEDAVAAAESVRDGEYLRGSYLGQMGHAIEPLVRPLGWDWRVGMAAIASFPAREVIVATLGVIFDLGGDADEESEDLRTSLKSATWPDGRPLFNVPVALGIMVFFALCMQCVSTLAIMRRETNSWRWPVFAFVYMTVLAYVGALITYQVGMKLL